ncbi:substrate-binding domain-containing protein [Streptomyces sp. HSG2]|uniref:sugar ABC transporter substrate-binding protein n=1 Tax=Streptomyces sp. HSG2 TaxID=2797167 RepID=UPI001908D47E|nr:substrate-binding domain-containing protein [Streptomyces sp. HSG2]
MTSRTGRAAVAACTVALAVSLSACGSAEQAEGDGEASANAPSGKGDDIRVGLLLPENQTARYERFDRPLIERHVKELTDNRGEVVYANAKQDATLQSQQIDTMITNKVDVLILDAVDARAVAGSVREAKEAGIPVVAFDRLAEGPVDAYTSFDNEQIGRVQAQALLEALGDDADKGQIVMMNGSFTDPNAAQFKRGAHQVLDGKVTVGKEYDTTEWKAEHANKNMEGAISALGKDEIVGVYSANDSMAGGVITALKAGGFSTLPPVTGQDAELSGVQRIVAGEQFMSVYKPYGPEAEAAAAMAVALARGEPLDTIAEDTVDSAGTPDIPAVLIPVVPLTRDNIQETVIADGVYTVAQICTERYRAACEELGLR